MTVPQPTFGPNGFIPPAEADVLVGVKEEINAAFDNKLNMADETPQGQIAVSQAAAIGNANDMFVLLTQQFDPAYNFGRYQDAIARIYFLSRIGARPTVVECLCTGLSGVQIPAGSLAIATDGNIYASTEDAVIEGDGNVLVTFACTTLGPIPCAENTVTTIYQAINGWDSITNADEGVIGRATETREELEARRYASVAKNSIGTLPAVRGSVLELDGVLDCYVTENVDNNAATVHGVLLGPKSIYVAVVGGNDQEIAETIWKKKAPGCGYNGNTAVTVTDSNSGYNPPYPSYSVSFQRPSSLPILFRVNVQNNPLLPANAVDLIQQAIILAFAGADGGERAMIGAEIFASRFYNAIVTLGPWAQLRFVKIGSNQVSDAVATGSISGTNMTISAMTSGTIAVGGTVSGGTVIAGTRILSQSSGTPGGVGVYVVNNSQTVTSTTLTMASTTQDTITPDIDLVPTIVPANIEVVVS